MNPGSPNAHERFLRLIHKTVALVDRGADRMLAENMGGTFSQYLILMATAHRRSGLSQQKIAVFLDITPAAMSRQVDGLVASGYLKREQDPDSRRSHIITLTEKGAKTFRAMHELLLSSFKGLTDITEKELDSTSDVLEKILAALHPESIECAQESDA